MPIMALYPQVREGGKDGEECSEKACPIPYVTPSERSAWPSEGGPNKCETISGMLDAQRQLNRPTTATATQQPRERCCGQETNNTTQRRNGQCIRSKSSDCVGRQGAKLSSMSSNLPKQFSPELFDQKVQSVQVQISECQSLVASRQEPMDGVSLPLLKSNLQTFVEKRLSDATVENNCEHVIDEEMTNEVRPKVLQQSPFAVEGQARAWPDLSGGKNPCHATKVSQISGSGGHEVVEPKSSFPNTHMHTVESFKIGQLKKNVCNESNAMTKGGMTKVAETPLRQPIPAIVRGKWQQSAAEPGWGVASNANQWSSPVRMNKGESVEPQFSHPYCQLSINSIHGQLNQRQGMTSTTTSSGSGWSISGMTKRETGPWQGLSKDDLSYVCDRYTPNSDLNKVNEKDNITPVPEASGVDFPHVVVLDFSQDLTLGRALAHMHQSPATLGTRAVTIHL